ncbi:MAG: collagen-like protein, partial [Gaiellales bacterium]
MLSLPGFMRATLVCTTVRGQKGLRGFRGSAGAHGLIGATGLQGVIGETGPTGLRGLGGVDGAAGPQGVPGAQGTPGAQGPRGLIGYASIYNVGVQNVPVASNVHFDSNGPMSDGFVHATGDAAITVVRAGTYKVTFVVTATQSNQIAVLVNGASVPGAVFGVGNAQAQNTGQAIVTLA